MVRVFRVNAGLHVGTVFHVRLNADGDTIEHDDHSDEHLEAHAVHEVQRVGIRMVLPPFYKIAFLLCLVSLLTHYAT